MAKKLEFKVHGLVRLTNPCINTYDHLITLSKCTNSSVYRLFIDMGCDVIPAAIWFSDSNELIISPIYIKELDNMKYHAQNVENINAVPIMVFDKHTFIDMFKQAHKSKEFNIIDNDVKKNVKNT